MDSPWDGMLQQAVRVGLGQATPNRIAALLDQSDTPSPIPASEAVGHSEEEWLALGAELRSRVSAGAARTIALLRGGDKPPDAASLRSELEKWLLDAGHLEAAVEDSLQEAAAASRESEASRAEAQAEANACRRALELHISNTQRDHLREAEDEASRGEERLRLEAELAQARAEVSGMAEQHGQRVREAQIGAQEASTREATLLRQVDEERRAARLALEEASQSDEAVRRISAKVALLESNGGREEETRRAWAEERREWADGAAAAAAAAAAKHDELFATLQACRRQLETSQLEAARAESRAAAADDRAAAAEGAREMSDGVWQEKLAAAQAETSLRRQEVTARDEALGERERERSSWRAAEAEMSAVKQQLGHELSQKDEAARALAAEVASLRDQLVSRGVQIDGVNAELESLAEEAVTLGEELDRARAELAQAKEESESARKAALEEARRAVADSESRLAQQETRWLAQAATWRDEMHEVRHKAAAAEARTAEAMREVDAARAEGDEACAKLRAKISMSEQAGGARAAALTAEMDRLRSLVELSGGTHHTRATAAMGGSTARGAPGAATASAPAAVSPKTLLARGKVAEPAAPLAAYAHGLASQVAARAPPAVDASYKRYMAGAPLATSRSQPQPRGVTTIVDARATLAALLDDAW